jgi:Ca2+-binding RTX toxin-like protein
MANITFGSNTVANGTAANDFMLGNEPTGNINDIIYGHQGDDTITTTDGLFNSTVYGGQGNDSIFGFTSGNQIYGNFGDDTIVSEGDGLNTIYGGQGNDSITSEFTSGNVIYGNLGNDSIATFDDFASTVYGGQGNDLVTVSDDARNDVVYGNFGNDLLVGHDEVFDSHLYGGQGNDTLVFTASDSGHEVTNDTMTGNLGSDTFVATNTNGVVGVHDTTPFSIGTSDIVTVTDFLSGTDQLAESHRANVPLVDLSGIGDNAQQALNRADAFYGSHGGARDYVFVYGGTGAGYLFYNAGSAHDTSASGSTFATTGMALVGNNQEGSLAATDITTIPGNVPFA